MDKDREYAEQWEVNSKYFYKQGTYEKLCDHIDKYNIVLEIGCGVGNSTLSLKEKGHCIISIEKNKVCIKKPKSY